MNRATRDQRRASFVEETLHPAQRTLRALAAKQLLRQTITEHAT
jgi:hypothetical protein